jgi:hypothetical protein
MSNTMYFRHWAMSNNIFLRVDNVQHNTCITTLIRQIISIEFNPWERRCNYNNDRTAWDVCTSRVRCWWSRLGARWRTQYRAESWLWGVEYKHFSALRLVCAPPSVYSSCILFNPLSHFISFVRAIQYAAECHIRQINQSVLHGKDVLQQSGFAQACTR